jgi:hypothetical protein
MGKEEFAELIQLCREKIASGKYNKCSCPEIKCEWHGKCQECVIIHRAFEEHVPHCMKPILRNKIKAIAQTIEFDIKPQNRTPEEYWDYVKSVSDEDKTGE